MEKLEELEKRSLDENHIPKLVGLKVSQLIKCTENLQKAIGTLLLLADYKPDGKKQLIRLAHQHAGNCVTVLVYFVQMEGVGISTEEKHIPKLVDHLAGLKAMQLSKFAKNLQKAIGALLVSYSKNGWNDKDNEGMLWLAHKHAGDCFSNLFDLDWD